MPTKRTRISKISKFLNQVGRQYWDSIPIGDIFETMIANGFLPLDEDGTVWSGMLCGAEGRVTFSLCDLDKDAGYYYLRYNDEVIDSVRLPMTTRPINFTHECTKVHKIHAVQQCRVSKAEHDTFHAMGCQTVDVYDESTMQFDTCNHCLVLDWYKMPSGRYEVTAYVS